MLVRPGEQHPPTPPDWMTEEIKAQWWDYWRSDVALAVRLDTDYATVERRFWLLNEVEKAKEEVEKHGRTVSGSQAQPVEHPMLKYMDRCMREIRQLDDRLGNSPRARAALGMAIKRAIDSLEDRSKRAQERASKEKQDPRLTLRA